MANKIVLVKKGHTTGMEFPLDVDTGTTLRGINTDGCNLFWVSIDPSTVTKYLLDAQGNTAREISSDRFTVSGGTINTIYGIGVDLASLYVNHHTLRSGIHRERHTHRVKTAGNDIDLIETETAVGDLGNRNLGLDFIGERTPHIYQENAAVGSRFRVARFHGATATPPYGPVDDWDLVQQNIKGISMNGQMDDFWTVGSDNVIRHFRRGGAEIESFTLTNSGTCRDLCEAGGGYLAVSMT